MYIVAAAALVIASFHLPIGLDGARRSSCRHARAGHGQMARCSSWCRSASAREIGVMTGLVGMTGGIGGFYLASSLGYSKQFTGSYQIGLLIFAILATVALVGLTSIKGRWRTTWGAVGMTTARI